MMLDEIDYRILTALGKNPLGTINELSKAVKVSPKTLAKRLRKLINNKIFLRVSAQLSYPTIGLEPVLVFMSASFRNLGLIEEVCHYHPYTRYRIRCLGAINGIIALFAIPEGSLHLLLQLLDDLKDRGIISSYSYEEPIARWIYVENDFSYYDIENDTWNFNWDQWEELVSSSQEGNDLEEYGPSILHKLDKKDMEILAQLTINAREKLKNIAEKCGVPIYHLSRRMNFYLQNKVIESFRVIVSSRASRVFDLFIFKCKCSIKVTSKFASAVKKLPFQLTFIPVPDGFVLQIFLPPSNVSELGRILQQYCDDISLIWADYKTSARYFFYPEPFVNGKWIASREYMVESVLEKLESKN